MNNIETKNAIISKAEITNDDHGVLSVWIDLDYGGAGQGFGGYALYLPQNFSYHKIESPTGHFIWRVMEVAEVTRWSQLKGKTVRVKSKQSKVYGIGHIVKDDWFYPGEDFAMLEEGKEAKNDR